MTVDDRRFLGSSPFLRHRFSSDDMLLPGLREAAAALCRAADRATLDEVIEVLKRAPRKQDATANDFPAPSQRRRRDNNNNVGIGRTALGQTPEEEHDEEHLKPSLSSSSLAQACACRKQGFNCVVWIGGVDPSCKATLTRNIGEK
jgi:hypothetical protein